MGSLRTSKGDLNLELILLQNRRRRNVLAYPELVLSDLSAGDLKRFPAFLGFGALSVFTAPLFISL